MLGRPPRPELVPGRLGGESPFVAVDVVRILVVDTTRPLLGLRGVATVLPAILRGAGGGESDLSLALGVASLDMWAGV